MPVDLTDDFCEWVDDQTEERLNVALERAKKRDTEFWSDETFNEVFTDELKRMYLADTFSDLVEKGIVVGDVRPDGEIGYSVAGGV